MHSWWGEWFHVSFKEEKTILPMEGRKAITWCSVGFNRRHASTRSSQAHYTPPRVPSVESNLPCTRAGISVPLLNDILLLCSFQEACPTRCIEVQCFPLWLTLREFPSKSGMSDTPQKGGKL
jgi:hypothetical protein